MAGRVRRKAVLATVGTASQPQAEGCALCGCALGKRVEWHHVVPKSEGGNDTVPLHPICHRTIHATASNAELARLYPTLDALREREEIRRFVTWIADKSPDFHAPTRRKVVP
jgi:hypothetical protein